jgi:hypothetical protein
MKVYASGVSAEGIPHNWYSSDRLYLKRHEFVILKMHFEEGLSDPAIAKRIGKSPVMVCKIRNNGLHFLRHINAGPVWRNYYLSMRGFEE